MSVESTVRGFTPQKARVAYWKAKGLQNKQIALKLGDTFSEEDVENTLRVIYSDLGYSTLANSMKAVKLRNEVEPIMKRLVGNDTSILDKFPLSTDATEQDTEEKPTRSPSSSKKRYLIPIALVLLCALGAGAFALRTFVIPEFQSARSLDVGDEIKNDQVTLKLKEVRYNELYDRVSQPIAPISYYFDFTNHSGDTLLLQADGDNFVMTDNTGYKENCWFVVVVAADPGINIEIPHGETRQIIARCGRDRMNENVSTVTLAITDFSSLSDSTWVHEVRR
jgi:hypothetical protein